jgi:hypothetical protein
MPIGSVWDWDKLRYDYYTLPGRENLGGFAKLDGLGVSRGTGPQAGLGIDIEQALPLLPRGARRTGTGTQAKGRIFKPPIRGSKRGLGEIASEPEHQLMSDPWIPAVLGAGTAFLVSHFVSKNKAVLGMAFFLGFSSGLSIGVHHAKYRQI